MSGKQQTREDWLHQAIAEMAPIFVQAEATLPPKIRVAIGFPSAGLRGRAIGECWDAQCSEDEHFEIFIRPDFNGHENITMQVLATLAHELVHAALGIPEGHGSNFKRVIKTIGLAGKATATYAGPHFIELMEPIVKKIGPLPHGVMTTGKGSSTRPKKQKNRHHKCACPECGYTVRLAKKWLEIGYPHCPLHGEMVYEDA